MEDALTTLGAEHRCIETVLLALERAARIRPEPTFYDRAIEFLVRFADEAHHIKEERHLFPLLEARGLPPRGPTGVMRHEHEVARGHVQHMSVASASGDADSLRRESLALCALMREHIRKEDEVLFSMAREILDDRDLERLAASFAAERRVAGDLTGYAVLAEELLREVTAGS